MIGVVMLIGIVKKNAIMMVDFAIERRSQGATAEQAIVEAAQLRFRPIMMTTTLRPSRRDADCRRSRAPAPSCASRSASPWWAA